MRTLGLLVLVGGVVACQGSGGGPKGDTDVDSDVADTDPHDTDGADTDVVDTDRLDTDTPIDDPVVDTATPLPEADDGPFHGAWVARGGSRLEAVHLTHDGTSQEVFSHFHDTLLDLDCRFSVAEDGRLRCLPVGVREGQGVSPPGCTRFGELIPKTCSAVRTITRGVYGATCGKPRSVVYGLTPDVSVTSLGEPGLTSCATVPLPDGAVFADEARVATRAADFVRGLAQVVATGGDVDVVVVRSNDGAVEPIGFYDPVRDVPCAPVAWASDRAGAASCVPGTDVHAGWGHDALAYSEDTCEVAVAVSHDVCDDASVESGLDADGPPFWPNERTTARDVTEVRDLGDVFTHGYWDALVQFFPPVTQCTEADFGTVAGPPAMRVLSDALGPDELPALRHLSLADGAPSVYAWVDRDGRALLPVMPTPFIDDGVPCAPVWDAAQDSVRCVPRTGEVTTSDELPIFADSVCTDRIVVARAGTLPGATTIAYAQGGAGCLGGWANDVPIDRRPLVIGEQVEPLTVYAWVTAGEAGPVSCQAVPAGEAGYYDLPDPAYFRVTVDPRAVTAWPAMSLR